MLRLTDYTVTTMLGDGAKLLIRSTLEALVKEGLVVAGPHRDSCMLAK